MKGIEGQQIVVTGASRGIGLAIAKGFVEAGGIVTTLADTPEVIEAASTIGAKGVIADITNAKAVAAAFARLDRIDVLINNAGLELLTPIEDSSPETLAIFRRIIDINIAGTAIVTSLALERMQAGARIVNTASVWGRVAEPLFGAYVASKHAVIGLTKVWARELGPRSIRVNGVAPGWVRTDASMRSARTVAAHSGQTEGAIIAAVEAGQALPGGFMEPEDITGPYLFLASDLSANITGQTLGIDRGEAPW